MKKILVAVLCLVMFFVLASCGDDTANTTENAGNNDTTVDTNVTTGAVETTGESQTSGTDAGTTGTTPVTENLTVSFDGYTAVKTQEKWTIDEGVDYSKYNFMGRGEDLINKFVSSTTYSTYSVKYYALAEDGTKTQRSTDIVKRLYDLLAVYTIDNIAKTIEVVYERLDIRILPEYTSMTGVDGSYIQFSFTTNLPTTFMVNIAKTRTTKGYFTSDGIVARGSNGTFKATASLTIPYKGAGNYFINFQIDCGNAGSPLITSIPIKVTENTNTSGYQLLFKGDWPLIKDTSYREKLVKLFYNVYPRLYARWGTGTEPTMITFEADKDYDGVAYCAGTTVCVSVDYANGNPNDLGFFSHEITHSVQQYGSKMEYGDGHWWTENMANYGGFRYFHWGYSSDFVQLYEATDTSLQDWKYEAYGNNKWFFSYMDARYPTTKNPDGTLKLGLIDSIDKLIKNNKGSAIKDDPYDTTTSFNKLIKTITGYDCMESLRLHYVDELKNKTWTFTGFANYVDNFRTENVEGVANPKYPQLLDEAEHGSITNPALATIVKPSDDNVNLIKGAKVVKSTGQTKSIESASKLVDGNTGTKWCCGVGNLTTKEYYLQGIDQLIVLDMGEEKTFNTYSIFNAGTYESVGYNAQDWEILISNDGENWTSIDYQSGNKANSSSYEVGTQTARYIMIKVIKADSGAGTVRLYEFMLFNVNK